ncbi:MAG: disulfide bond formation protein DsbA [Deltaproteobacteria bacterium]|nr:disulfide bond formation protein DsbA [Deltaproteobacteria bacterium]
MAVLLLLGLAVAVGLYQRSEERQQAERLERAKTDDSIFIRPHSRSLGPADAKVTLVEFLDPECESCRAVHPMVKELLERYRGRLRLVVRYMPLHPNSVFAVGALEAAGAQGRYWEMLETLFEHQPIWGSHHAPRPDLIPGYARQIGLDMEAFQAYLDSGAHRGITERDEADGRALGVRGTPTFFVNEQPVQPLGYGPLKAMIEEELAR